MLTKRGDMRFGVVAQQRRIWWSLGALEEAVDHSFVRVVSLACFIFTKQASSV